MQIFLDCADDEVILPWKDMGIISGITTNPTNLSKVKKNPTEQILKLCSLFPEWIINVEVTESEPEKVYQQAYALSLLASNIVVKIPCHFQYYEVIKRLVKNNIRINITLVFSLLQALMMAKLSVFYISAFVGRLDEAGGNGLLLLQDIRCMLDQYQFSTQLLAASIRTQDHFNQAVQAGADVVTVSNSVLQSCILSELTDQGIAQFHKDWKSLNISKFP